MLSLGCRLGRVAGTWHEGSTAERGGDCGSTAGGAPRKGQRAAVFAGGAAVAAAPSSSESWALTHRGAGKDNVRSCSNVGKWRKEGAWGGRWRRSGP